MEKRVVSISLVSDTLKEKIIKIKFDDTTMEDAKKLIDGLLSQQELFYKIINDISTISFVDDPQETDQTKLCISSLTDFKEKLKERASVFRDLIKADIPIDDKKIARQLLQNILLDCIIKNGVPFYRSIDVPVFEKEVNKSFDILASHYYSDEDAFFDYLLDNSNKSRIEILQWFNDKERFILFNDLLDEQYQNLIISAPQLLGNFPSATKQLEENILTIDSTLYKKNYPYPKLSKEELDLLTKEFFSSIDETGEWLRIYESYCKDRIIYQDSNLDPNKTWSVFLDHDQYQLMAPLKGDISDFIRLIHEIAHLVSIEKERLTGVFHYSIDEFSSIFLEHKAIDFLNNKGYNQDAINNLYLERDFYASMNSKDLIALFQLLEEKRDCPFTLEDVQNNSAMMRTRLLNQGLSYTDNIDCVLPLSEDDISFWCDQFNFAFLRNPEVICEEYSYLCGTELAKLAIQREKTNPELLPKLLLMIPSINGETSDSIMTKLDLYSSKEVPVQKVKKEIGNKK